ncbi:hypothetical protein [Clostridium lacusfryxellense]|uniref:hypothetical protein n=1 Tax=Clostridium lacusfryxellense TaxID=205328 RepID=UPI001C0ACAF7|nr:hypothetical protein [Clostridium lacusfryxellense]MBU3114773.1 hypothetical protein [Clostridium lacusfryxellense]
MENKIPFMGYIVSATGMSLAGAYKVIDYALAAATVASVIAAVLTAGGIAIGTVLIKKVLVGASKGVAKSVMGGW